MLKDYIEIKIAAPTDALPVANVGRITFYETWEDVNTPEDMKLYCDEAFDLERIENDIRNPLNTFLLASMNGKIAGYVKLRRDRTREELGTANVLELERIYALKEFQSKKIGYSLMKRSIEIASAEKVEWMWLGVNEFNFKAMDFYKRFDFEVFGIKRFKLGNAEDNDFLMKKKF